MSDVLMPKLSDSMEQGTVISWFKSTGDHVELGEELLEIETDKSTAPYCAETAGVLEILTPVGTTAAVGEVIARIEVHGIEARSATPERAVSVDHGVLVAAEALKGEARPEAEIVADQVADAPSNGSKLPRAVSSKATPLARRVAAKHGIALESIEGTGPLGRVTRADVLRAGGIESPIQRGVLTQEATTGRPSQHAGIRRQELTRVQRLIASRMSEAKATVPHFQVQTEVDVGAVLALRAELKAYASEAQPAPSLNDVIVRAAALALRAHPLANGSFRDGVFELHDAINIGIAVATDHALVVPTVFNADNRALGQIACETRRLAEAVRDGSLAPRDLEGGTFTVSNLGMFGMTAIAPVINTPQAAILGVGAVRSTLARVAGEIVDLSLLTLTLSCDHRILYGADAARFLADIRDLLEAPLRLLL